MKFKKTSIIGAVLTLVLVLAVSVAFASEPKQPDSIEFEGMTFSRGQFSQETLDWLEWYLSLSEEERLRVSYIPHELLEATTNSASNGLISPAPDAQVDEYDSSMSVRTVFENGMLKQLTITLDALEEDLAVQASNGSMTSAETARVLALAESIAKDGVLDWTFQTDCGLTYEELGNNSTAICRRDTDGNLVPVSLSSIVASFILPQAMGEDLPVYVEPDDVEEPVGRMGSEFYAYNFDTADIANDGIIGTVDASAARMTLNGYQALLNQLVEEGKLSREDADHFFAGASQGLAQSEANTLYVTSGGSYAIMGPPPCILADCGNNDIHQHDGVTYSGWIGGYNRELTLCTDESCIVPGEHYHGYSNPVLTNPNADDPPPLCTRDDCHETGEHEHNGACYSGHTTGYVSSSGHHSESHHNSHH